MPLTNLRFTWAAPQSQNRDSEFGSGLESCPNFTVLTFFLFVYLFVYSIAFQNENKHVYFLAEIFFSAHYSLSTTSCGCLPVSGSYYGEKKDLLFR